MGLGKTLQGLAIAAAFRSEWPLLIVTPSSVRFTWREQILRWLGGPLNIHRSDIDVVCSARAFTTDDYLNPRQGPSLITVLSYDLLSRCAAKLSEFPPFGVVIMDESHFLKNFKTARTKAAMPMLKAAKRVILLTGTPALSRPVELFPQITAVRPSLFKGGFHEFGLRYCAAKENPWGWDYSGCSNMQELQIILEATIMIRRVKSDVLSQLPPKRREVVILDPSLIKSASIKHLECKMSAVELKALEKHGELLRYFKETSRVKLSAVEQYVSDLLEADRKFIVFAHHVEMLDAIHRLLDSKSVRFIRIDGKTPSDQRQVVCERFQLEEACKVALLSITAAGTGINLTAATLVVFAELFWNPGILIQAEDRAYRIGQQDSVNVRYLLAEGTADDHIWTLVKTKLDVLTRAGLNQESFENVDLTRAQASEAGEFFPSVRRQFSHPTQSSRSTSERPSL
uniref:SWI/SNF-related matrix-associated actin-dependent regulator of chromatin subfamily A-like protein 1 n=3 Tax=Schistocephalus solidus TaxID=70667 RepID=A0A0X3P1Z3_SCHSO